MEKEKIDQIRSNLFNSKLMHLPDNGGDCFETANVMRYINSVEELVSEQKAEIERLRKAGDNLVKWCNKKPLYQPIGLKTAINIWCKLTKKEGNNG